MVQPLWDVLVVADRSVYHYPRIEQNSLVLEKECDGYPFNIAFDALYVILFFIRRVQSTPTL